MDGPDGFLRVTRPIGGRQLALGSEDVKGMVVGGTDTALLRRRAVSYRRRIICRPAQPAHTLAGIEATALLRETT